MEMLQHGVYPRHMDQEKVYIRPDQRPVPVFDPPCDCPECDLSYFPSSEQNLSNFCYMGSYSNFQARSILDTYQRNISSDRTYLINAIERHGNTILRRWRNRSRRKRATLLEEINPALPKKAHDRILLGYAGITLKEHREKHRQTHLVPYLDIDTLSKDPAILIGLLEHRTKLTPQLWAVYDSYQLTVAWSFGLLDVFFNKNCVVMYGDEYGKLVPWEKDAAHRADIVGFPRARLILEAQAYLLGFLRKMVESLSAGIEDKEQPSSEKWKQFVKSGLKNSGEHTYWSSFTFGPFSAPPSFDIDALYAQAKARVDSTGDHLEHLQTQPAYMRRHANAISQMYTIAQNKNNIEGYRMISAEITGDVDIHWSWKAMCDELQYVRDLYGRHHNEIVPGQRLPEHVDDALGALEVLLIHTVNSRSLQLQAILPQHPSFCQWYDHRPYDAKTGIIEFTVKSGINQDVVFRQDPLWWCILQLQGPPDEVYRYQYPYDAFLKFLDDHLASSPQMERARLDELLYEKLSDYATLLEMLMAVRLHRPKSKTRDLIEIAEREDRFAWRRFKAKNVDFPKDHDYRPGLSMKRFQNTPLPSGPRNASWLLKFDAAHGALQDFWKSVHDVYRIHNRDCEHTEDDIDSFMRPISVWNSQGYRDGLVRKREDVLRDTSKPKQTSPNDDLWLPLPTGVDTISRPVIPEPKAKPKTRGEQVHASFAETEIPVDVPGKKTAPTQISLRKRSLKVVRSMFAVSTEERKMTVDWDDFVWAMEDAGFRARFGGGSIVVFEEANGGGKINFHRPHPDPKIDPIMLQSMGRRMHKWFGWTREAFVLVGK